MRLRLQRENTYIPAAPPRYPDAASAAADSPSDTRNNSASNPANNSSVQSPIRSAKVSIPAPRNSERRLQQFRHATR